MRIKVEVKNEILGDSVFWEGDSKDIKQIKNKIALGLAIAVANDGSKRKYGMWVVSKIKES